MVLRSTTLEGAFRETLLYPSELQGHCSVMVLLTHRHPRICADPGDNA